MTPVVVATKKAGATRTGFFVHCMNAADIRI